MERKISDFATVQMGVIIKRIQISGDDMEDAAVYEIKEVLMPKHIVNGRISRSGTEKEEICLLAGEKRAKYTAQGDVVIKLTSPYDAAYVTEDAAGLIVPSYCALISDIDSNVIDARYLSGFLNTAYARRLLQTGINGTYGMLKVKDIGNLSVASPDITEQRALGKAYELIGRKRGVLMELLSVEEKIADNLISEAVMEVLRCDVQ